LNSRGLTDALVLEVMHHNLRLALTTAKIDGDVFPHRFCVGRPEAAHRLSRLQVKKQPQLAGRLVGNRLRDQLGLTERKSFSYGPTLRPRGQDIQAFVPYFFDPDTDGLPGETEYPGRFQLGHSIPNSPPTDLLLRGRFEDPSAMIIYKRKVST